MEERIIKDINNLFTQLFQKMKEAGYEWDAEKKELKKIELVPVDTYKEWYDFIRWFVKQRTDNYTLIPSDDDIYKWGDNILNHARKVLEQKPAAWSEEDEHWRQKAIDFMKHPDLIKATPTLAKDTIDWLKSLRPQKRWKPSDEQMNALDSTLQYSNVSHNSYEHLNLLYNDLKKLKE